jgi:hypothetical protein
MRATGRGRSRPLIDEALSAARETRTVEFKEEFDPSDRRSLCETLKDVLAMANSGGGVIVVGVDGQGRPTGGDVSRLLDTDPADLANKLAAFTGRGFDALVVRSYSKAGKVVATVEVGDARTPLVPVRPGTYETARGKQERAFSVGVVYVRHGAKSEPATSHDLERIIERRLREVRSFWLKGVRRVTEAPPDSVVTVAPGSVRVVSDRSGSGRRRRREGAAAVDRQAPPREQPGAVDADDGVLVHPRVAEHRQFPRPAVEPLEVTAAPHGVGADPLEMKTAVPVPAIAAGAAGGFLGLVRRQVRPPLYPEPARLDLQGAVGGEARRVALGVAGVAAVVVAGVEVLDLGVVLRGHGGCVHGPSRVAMPGFAPGRLAGLTAPTRGEPKRCRAG